MDSLPSACLNCAAPLSGPFCSACGQGNVRQRLDTKDIARDVVGSLLGVDATLPRTLRDLTLRPGLAVRDYIAGHRRRYVGPPQYFLLALGVLLLVFSFRGVHASSFTNPQPGAGLPPEVQDTLAAMMTLMDSHLQFLLGAYVPFLAWSAAWLQRRSGLNFAENCTLFLYVIAHASILGSVPRLVAGLGGATFNTVLGLASLAYYAWAARSFYGCSWLRAIATILVGYVAWLVVFSVTVLIVVGTAIVLATR